MTPQERKVMELEEILDYNPQTGSLTWKVRRGSKGAGTIASYKNTKGYVGICIDRKHMKAHRVAWLMTYGELPNGDIDHIDGNPSNNKLDNLRDVSHSANIQNRKSATVKNKTGFLGVVKRKNKFAAHVHRNGKQIYLGLFETAELAHQTYKENT